VVDLPLANRHETVLKAPDSTVQSLLDEAATGQNQAAVLAQAVRHDPSSVAVWFALVATTTDPVTRYAYARVGYHRGLDALRAAGWGGTGLVRWSRTENRPFLRCLAALRDAAAGIGETAEVDRITAFLRDLDPDWDDAFLAE